MKIIRHILLICGAFLVMGCTVEKAGSGTRYYLDAKIGNDSNTGLSEGQAWKSLDRVNGLQLKAGDSLLLHRGDVYTGKLEINAHGDANSRVYVGAYGEGEDPKIIAPDSSSYAVLIKNSDYLTIKDLDITNRGSQRLAGRTGVKVLCEEYGISRHIVLDGLSIHDINGTLLKHSGEGSGILIQTRWEKKPSAFDSLTIENCIIRRCERNGISWDTNWDRKRWFPNTHTVVRKNLIEEVPGDGIVPYECDGALIEYNLMRLCTNVFPIAESAVGIWPWSCDNTVIQFNEVSGHKATWDGQGFDSDFNCNNTVIQYNYSHDNDGGFVLICCPGPSECDTTAVMGNDGTIVQYNISINDGIRTRETHQGMFSPIIHIGGTTTNTRINNNILHANKRPNERVDRNMITSDSWGGYSHRTWIKENVFYSAVPSDFEFSSSTEDYFDGNYYLGTYSNIPDDKNGKFTSAYYESLLQKDPSGFEALAPLMRKVPIANGEAYITTVDREAIEIFFKNMHQKE